MSHAKFSDAEGKPRIVVTTDHVQRALGAMRGVLIDHAPNDKRVADLLTHMDRLTLDEVMLAATLVATVDRVHRSSGAGQFIMPLVAEGCGGIACIKGMYDVAFPEWDRMRASHRRRELRRAIRRGAVRIVAEDECPSADAA